MRLSLACLLLALATATARGDNLLRNGDFQDDWSTLLPELKNHHWNYTTEVYNRRDYNPDGWSLGGKWVWKDADKPHGQRKLVLASGSRAVQSVNWVTINNSAKLAGWPDAGGFPGPEAVRTKQPLALVRDLEFRVKLSGTNVGKDAVKLVVAWSSASPVDDPLGTKRVASATVSAPEGTYAAKEVSVKLPAATWLAEARKDPLFAAQGALVPMAATVEIVFADKSAGTVELIDAALVAPASTAPNVLPNPSFETVNKDKWPAEWTKPRKYRYFPPGVYYIFNTWHNSTSENRGNVFVDDIVRNQHRNALAMHLATGDEVFVASAPIPLNQTEARLIEVTAMVRTDQLAMFQIDAEDENGKRVDGFNFIHKAMPSVGTNDWREVRQVFRPAAPLKSIRLKLCARGTNGNTQDGTGPQPQQNADGMVWWDAVKVCEPESTAAELAARKVKEVASEAVEPRVYLDKLQFGERLLGKTYLTAEVVNPTKEQVRVKVGVHTIPGSSSIVTYCEPLTLAPNARAAVRIEHGDSQPTPAYYGSRLGVIVSGTEMNGDYRERTYSGTRWPVAMDLRLGALYLQPDQKQFVRLNLGLTADALARVQRIDYEIVRLGTRATDKPLKTVSVPFAADTFEKQRAKIPDGLRGDFRNLLLADLDVSFLPLQPFADPQRNWVVRAVLIDARGTRMFQQDSPPFCRLAHDAPQPAITSVKINADGDFLVNDKPWMPWGVTYGHNPVYAGPAEGAKVHDLANLKMWSLYDRHGGNLADRALWDINCLRHVEGPAIKQPQLEEMWKKNLYASTVFLKPRTAKEPWPDDLLKYLRTAPNVAAVSRGPEEAFGHFYPMTPAQLAELKAEVDALRAATGKPVMVGHGGYWTRLELEKVPFFDIFDPETEPWYPAPLHTDLAPLVAGKGKVMWLRPQMYESVPYERWRYHVYVELMRGARGWQIAHGPGDPSLLRGLHAELRHVQPFVYSKEKPPEVKIGPGFEHMTRKLGNKTLIVAATTHGIPFGNWRPFAAGGIPSLAVETAPSVAYGDEADGYKRADDPAAPKFVGHGIQYLPNPQKWPAGSKLVTRVYLDKLEPKGLALLVKCDGRWTHAAQWGASDYSALRTDPATSLWFLHTFYRHSRGFLGWGDKVPDQALELIPKTFEKGGLMPATRGWTPIEIPLDKIGATDKLLDGVGFLHPGTGGVLWTGTKIVGPDGNALAVFNDVLDVADPTVRKQTKVFVAGLKKGTKVRVLFEDRELVAEDGFFVDDFRGADLYQRFGGERSGHGSAPVALHLYEVAGP